MLREAMSIPQDAKVSTKQNLYLGVILKSINKSFHLHFKLQGHSSRIVTLATLHKQFHGVMNYFLVIQIEDEPEDDEAVEEDKPEEVGDEDEDDKVDSMFIYHSLF